MDQPIHPVSYWAYDLFDAQLDMHHCRCPHATVVVIWEVLDAIYWAEETGNNFYLLALYPAHLFLTVEVI